MVHMLFSLALPSMQVIALTRYAIKGLSGDSLTTVCIRKPGETFPDDRRFALLKQKGDGASAMFNPGAPIWIHKENFLCAFSAPELMATFDTEYLTMDLPNNDSKMLTIWKQENTRTRSKKSQIFGPVDIATISGRNRASHFFSQACGEPVNLVTTTSDEHTHQFGNTRSGVRSRQDTRTVHLVNAATVRQVSEKLGVLLRPSRFRPNIVVDGIEPWEEFKFVGKTLQVHSAMGWRDALKLDVISRTVRCDGIGIDPLDEPALRTRLDMPKLLADYFPEHGPYLGVYAVTSDIGSISVGDRISVVEC